MTTQRCVTGKDPQAPVSVPSFDSPFWRGELIEEVADKLINHYSEFSWLRDGDYKIAFFWKGNGGRSMGQDVVGKATKGSGLIGYLTDATYVIWIAADHVQERGFSNYEFEALVYHELTHLTEDETENSAGELVYMPTLRNHDFQGFYTELDRYGLWQNELRGASNHFATQLRLEMKQDQHGPELTDIPVTGELGDTTGEWPNEDGVRVELSGGGKRVVFAGHNPGQEMGNDIPTADPTTGEITDSQYPETEPTNDEIARAIVDDVVEHFDGVIADIRASDEAAFDRNPDQIARDFSAKGDGVEVVYDRGLGEYRTREGDIYASGSVEDAAGVSR